VPTNGKIFSTNRKASFDYHILERLEAGLVLTGTEIKAIRAGQVSIGDSFAAPQNGELWLFNAHISAYAQGSIHNHEPTRPRKLLLHKEQIRQMISKVSQKRLTIVPLKLYVNSHVAKVELALAQGKRQYDKRRTIMDREMDREARRALRHDF
jgi:SsrA-binding protein